MSRSFRDELTKEYEDFFSDAYNGALETKEGEEWYPRLERSEKDHNTNATDWEELRALMVELEEFSETVSRDGNGVYVSLAWSVVQNLTADIYYKNPDPWITPRGQSHPDLPRVLRDVARVIHTQASTEEIFRDALVAEGFAGFAGHWASFLQYDRDVPVPLVDDAGFPVLSPDGEVEFEIDESGNEVTEPEAYHQGIVGEFVSPWDLRFDPDGRRWDLLDHKYVIRKYWKSLKDFAEDDDYDKTGIRMLKAYVRGHQKGSTGVTADDDPDDGGSLLSGVVEFDDKDPAYVMVECNEVWDRTKRRILHIPTGAKFHIKLADWPEDFAEANHGQGEFPLTLIALNKAPEDKRKKKGFWPIPTLRLIRSQLLAIQRLEYLYLESATTAIRKYLAIKGLLGDDEIAKIQDDSNRDVISVDVALLSKVLGAGAVGLDPLQVDLRRMIVPLMNPEDGAEMQRIEAAIGHQMQMIWQILGQGPGDRGGLADAGSATEALNLAARLEKRIDAKVEQMGKIYDRVTEKFFLLLKGRQTLPVAYARATGPYAEEMWGEFHADEIRDMDLVFKHRTGAQRPRTRVQDFQERSQIFAAASPLSPFAGDTELLRELFLWSIEPLEASDGFVERVRKRVDAREIAKQVAQMEVAIAEGQMDPTDPQVANQLHELQASLVNATLTDEDIARMVSDKQATQDASAQKPKSAGALAYQSALPGEGNAAAGRAGTGVN